MPLSPIVPLETPVGEVETGFQNAPLHWPLNPTGGPVNITVAIAAGNLPSDQGVAAPFNEPFPAAFVPLLTAAEEAWESVANIQFLNIPDGIVPEADIRVGVSALNTHLGLPNTMGFIGYTEYHYSNLNQFSQDTTVTVEDPAEHPLVALPNGDFQYANTSATVFQVLLHELGHGLGLAHNSADLTAIMNPVSMASNRVPDAQDVAALQSLYGAPTTPLALSLPDMTALTNLTA
jgi:hypothetical protein